MCDWLQGNLPPPGRPLGKRFPSLYPGFVRELERRLNVGSQVEDSYQQGFASYLDVWLYKDDRDFALPTSQKGERYFTGLYILLCRLLPYYVMGEGAKSWSVGRGSSYMPSFEGTDRFQTAKVAELAVRAEEVLAELGMTRLRRADVAKPLPSEFRFESNLVDGEHKIFDGLFFWND